MGLGSYLVHIYSIRRLEPTAATTLPLVYSVLTVVSLPGSVFPGTLTLRLCLQ